MFLNILQNEIQYMIDTTLFVLMLTNNCMYQKNSEFFKFFFSDYFSQIWIDIDLH